MSELDIIQKIFELLARRAATASICPSEVARALASDEGHWRALMPHIRTAASKLAEDQMVTITQGSQPVMPNDVDSGAIRLRRGPRFSERTGLAKDVPRPTGR